MLENDVLMEKSTVQIQQEEASEEYIKRFPTKLQCQYGPADFQEGKTHHNWYLFKDKIDSASSEFKIIEVDELCQKNIGTKSGE